MNAVEKTSRFVVVTRGLLARASEMVDDHVNPKPRGYAAALVPFSEDDA